jgi:TP901 family phage tail tape measure protein
MGFSQASQALGSVDRRIDAIGSAIDRMKKRQRDGMQAMDREYVWGGNSVRKYAEEIDRLGKHIDALTARKTRLRELGAAHANARADMNSRVGDVAAAYGMGRMLHAPIGAHVRQDDALNALQVAMMDKDGKVPKSYEALKKQAVELGNVLPGTTADFAGTARALMEQGVAIDSVLGGGLKAAANMSVVLRMPADQAGEMAAKLREAYKLSDSELTKMADSMQRAKFAFGMKPSDLMAASSYQAPMLNQLGISGLGNTNKMLAIQGMAANVGLEGSSFGTNFSMMLSRLAKGPLMVEEAKKGMKAEARHILEKLDIKFDFFDKKGNFAGLDHMVKELEKLRTIKEKLGDKAALEVAEAMFGAEAGRPAMILAEQGMKGFAEAQKKMADQASLDDRIKKTLESTKNTWESLTGSIENFGAAAAGPAVRALHPLINQLNNAAGALTAFTEKHPTAAKWIGLGAIAIIGGAVALLSLGTALSVARFAWTGAQLLPGMMRLGGIVGWLGRLLGGSLVTGLRLAGQALFFIGRALIANPIGIAIMVIAGAAYLIYRNWDKIKPWFQGLWRSVVTIFNGTVAWFRGLPARFGEIGRNLIDGLINGVMGKINAAREAIIGIGSKIKGWFSETLGIKSPSRVFVGFGNNIGEGAALGISGSVSRVKNAVGKLSGAAMAGVSAASSTLNAMSGGSAGAGGTGKLDITYSPTVHVQGGSDIAGQVKRGLDLSLRELEQMIQRLMQEQARRAYA